MTYEITPHGGVASSLFTSSISSELLLLYAGSNNPTSNVLTECTDDMDLLAAQLCYHFPLSSQSFRVRLIICIILLGTRSYANLSSDIHRNPAHHNLSHSIQPICQTTGLSYPTVHLHIQNSTPFFLNPGMKVSSNHIPHPSNHLRKPLLSPSPHTRRRTRQLHNRLARQPTSPNTPGPQFQWGGRRPPPRHQ